MRQEGVHLRPCTAWQYIVYSREQAFCDMNHPTPANRWMTDRLYTGHATSRPKHTNGLTTCPVLLLDLRQAIAELIKVCNTKNKAEECRQSYLFMQATGQFDVLHAIRDLNTYIALREALDNEIPAWEDAIANISPLLDNEGVKLAAMAAGHVPPTPRSRTQLWEPCPRCGAEPISLEYGVCENCEAGAQ